MEQTKNEVKAPQAGGARVQKNGIRTGGGGSAPLIALAVAAAIIVGVYGGLCAVAAHGGSLWKGTRILGQDVGGMAPEEAVAAVESALGGQAVGLYLYDSAQDGIPARDGAPDKSIPLTDLGAQVDVPGLVSTAMEETKSGSILTAGWRYLTHKGTETVSLEGFLQVDAAKTAAAAEAAAEELSWDAQDTTYTMTDDTVQVQMAQEGRSVSAQALQEALSKGEWDVGMAMDVPYSMVPGTALTAQEIHDEVYGEVKNAGYDAASGSIIPEQTGADFDVPSAQQAMDAAAPGETVTISAQIQYPAVTAESLKAVLFRDVLGECTTSVGGTAARRTNVRLASSAFNGVVMNTGDVFSYNGTVGQRTTAKGYQAAPAYVQGETVNEVGGGVCQPSSTLYLACLRANLEITERYPHRYAPSYIDWGMDATVSWGGPDYKFTNNTDYPIKVVTSYADNKLTVKILGTNVDGTYVKMTNKTISSTPFQTVYKDDPSLPAGAQRVQTTPYTGHNVQSFRNVYSASGELLSSKLEAVSDYKVRNKVILQGPGAASAPAETPAETPPTGETTAPPAETTPTAPTEPTAPEEPAAPVTPNPPADVPTTAPPAPEEPPVVIVPLEPEE